MRVSTQSGCAREIGNNATIDNGSLRTDDQLGCKASLMIEYEPTAGGITCTSCVDK